MSTCVVGIIPADEKYLRMKEVYLACKKAGVDMPDEVERFFDGELPEPDGMTIELEYKEWIHDNALGLEIDLSNIPKSVTRIRFYNSW